MKAKDKITIICPIKRFANEWADSIRKQVPEFEVQIYPDDSDRESVEFVMAFDPQPGAFAHFPNLKVVASMGAGVRAILTEPGLPENVTVTKIVQPMHQRDMADFVLALTLSHLRKLPVFFKQQQEKVWKHHSFQRPEETTVGIMGIGAIGRVIGELFVKNGFKVTGWSRTEKKIAGIQTFYGNDQRNEFLGTAQILVCILPLTDETTGILNKEVFARLPKGAYLINVARGGHLVEKDLLEALESGQLSGAALDVFSEEPLPAGHPFWAQEKIFITPHNAGNTHPEAAFKKVLQNYYALKNGGEFVDVVDRKRGY